MPKVYLSPPYHYNNVCAISGCDENKHNNEYLDELVVYLKACGIEYKRGPRRIAKTAGNGDQMMINAVAESNAWGADLHYISHTNASSNGTARGYHPMIYPGSEKGRKAAECIIEERRKIYDQSITLIPRSDLYELRKTTAPAVYEEHVFHDNEADARWFHNHLRQVAEATARGMCRYFGVKFVDPYDKPAAPELCSVSLPILRQGSNSGYVRTLQILLNKYNGAGLSEDGDFGPATNRAVVAYQRSRGLDADGICGTATWTQLLK